MIAMVHHAISELLAKADIHIGGKRPWDIRLQTPGVIEHAIAKGNLGFGEAYMDGDCEGLFVVEDLENFAAISQEQAYYRSTECCG